MSDDYETERGYAEVLEEVRGHASKRLTAWVLLTARKKARRQRRVLAEMNEKVAKLEAEHAEAVALLRKHTYKINSPDDPGGECIECGQYKEMGGHFKTCELGALLSRIDGGSGA